MRGQDDVGRAWGAGTAMVVVVVVKGTHAESASKEKEHKWVRESSHGNKQ